MIQTLITHSAALEDLRCPGRIAHTLLSTSPATEARASVLGRIRLVRQPNDGWRHIARSGIWYTLFFSLRKAGLWFMQWLAPHWLDCSIT